MASSVSVTRTNNAEIDGLLGGTKWAGTVTYSFPDSPSDYAANYSASKEPTTGFSQAPAAEQHAINYAVALILSYTNVSIQFAGTNGADIRVAQSSAANPTSYAYYPSNSVTGTGGDVWFGTAYNYSLSKLGNYYFTTAIHELGHAFGLKHSQELGGVANVAVPAAHDDSEFTVMSYRSYVGGPLTGYTNEAYGYPQTYMANDILALQTLYGANFATHQENTVYSWSPTTGEEFINGVGQGAPGGGVEGASANRVFMTVWDGNGVDSYDLSNYATAVTIDLNPGASSITSSTQIAYLGNGHYAQGNVYNAYLYNNDARSYIDNAIGGSGDDSLVGNAVANKLDGGAGNDTLTGGAGNDAIIGGLGTDTVVFSGTEASYQIAYNFETQTFTVSDLRAGSPDGNDTVTGVENFKFLDGIFASSALTTAGALVHDAPSDFDGNGKSDILWLNDNGTVGAWDNGQPVGAHTFGVVPAGWHIAGAGDFDGNGKSDILWFNDNGTVGVWDNGQPVGAHTFGVVPAGWHIAGAGDFDGNGKSDILWLNDNGTVGVWDNGQPGGAHSVANAGAVASTSHVVGLGDFDNNSHDDILWQDNNGAVFVWDNGQPAGGHTLASAGLVPGGWHIAGAGDFDGNGLSDILWANDNGTVGVWDNGQPGGAHTLGVVPAEWHIAGAGDFDANGKSDILWINDNGTVGAWDNGQPGGAHTLGGVLGEWHIV